MLLTYVCFAGSCLAQPYELGGSIGYGAYRQARINSPAGEAAAGIKNRFAAGAVFCEDMYDHFSGEIRYTYQDGDPFLSLGAKKAGIQGQSHAFHYDVLFHARDREQRLRPYLAAGAGAKYYRATGAEPVPQPVPQIADLVQASQWRFLVSVGGGVKYRLADHYILRADFRDYLTPFPKRLYPVTGTGTPRGIFQQFTPMFGLSYVF